MRSVAPSRLLFLLLLTIPTHAQNKPNLILILCDDLGYGDLPGYAPTATARTPHLDRLAKEGLRFTDFYCAGAQCTPSRAGLLTGRYPARFGLTYALMTDAPAGIPDNEILLPQLLQKQGYATMLAGKWHLGDQSKHHPLRHGFDHFTGLLRGHDTDPRQLYQDQKIIDQAAPLDTLTERFTTAATDFIIAQANDKKPFFLMLAHTAPHAPLVPGQRFKGKSPAGPYADTIEEIDDSLGQILAALKRANVDDNTLIFFTSDNGPSKDANGQGGSAGPLRGGKFSTLEGGLRVPAIAWFPAKIKPAVNHQPAILLDLFPTFLKLANAKPPNDRPIDGQDLTQVLFQTANRHGQDFFFYFRDEVKAHRSAQWKLTLPQKPTTPPALYDLEKDPEESTDLANQHPEIITRLKVQITAHQKAITTDH